MSLEDRVKTLQDKKNNLEQSLEVEERRPLPDNIAVHDI